MQNTVKKIIKYASQVADPSKIILFGSMNNGKSNEYSDVDLLIFSDDKNIHQEIKQKIKSFSKELSLKVDVLIYSESDIMVEMHKPHSFIGAVLKAGKIVYEKGKFNVSST